MKYLKIKDTVDLDQLEKYGFEKKTKRMYGEQIDYLFYKNDTNSILLQVNLTKTAKDYLVLQYHMNSNWYYRPIPEIIFDLIENNQIEIIELDY